MLTVKNRSQVANKPEAYCHPRQMFQSIDGVIHFVGVNMKEIKDLPVQEGDIFVNTFPKSGTTWVSEITWQILMDGAIDSTPIHEKVPFLEAKKMEFMRHAIQEQELNLHEFYLKKAVPRVFKTHLPYHQTPMGHGVNKPKHIYVVRNPKDAAVSFYWHYKRSQNYFRFDRSWNEFFEIFIEGNVHYGSWFDHVLGWWAHRDDPNILFLKYEDMKKNLSGTVQQIAKFLGKDLSLEMIERIADQTTFAAMSDGKGRFYDGDKMITKLIGDTGIKFIRKGEVGDWRNYFTEEQNKRLDALYESKMAGSGLQLDFD